MKKRMLTFGMAMLIVLSLAACNGSSSSGSSNETTPPSASQSDATKEVTESQESSPTQGGTTVGPADSAAEPEFPNVRDKPAEQNTDLTSAPVQTEPPEEEPVLSQPSEPTEVLKIRGYS